MLLQHTVRTGHALVLAQMLCPCFEKECFHESSRLCGVFENTPCISAVAATLGRELLQGKKKPLPIFARNAIFDRDHYGSLFVRYFVVHHRGRPVHRWREIELCTGLKLPAVREHNRGKSAGG